MTSDALGIGERELVIDRSVWQRGGPAVESMLLRPKDGKQCCVGIYLRACGVPDAELMGVSYARVLMHKGTLPAEAAWLETLSPGQPKGGWEESISLAVANDEPMSESKRETIVREVFARNGVRVRFVGDGSESPRIGDDKGGAL